MQVATMVQEVAQRGRANALLHGSPPISSRSAQGEAQVGCKGGDPQRAGQDGPEVELEQQAGEGGGQRLRALTQLQQDDQVLSGGEERAGEAKKG